jgi:hypothetical protein
MPDHLPDDIEKIGLSDIDIRRIADALVCRMIKHSQDDAPPATLSEPPQQVALHDLCGIKEAAHLANRNERTIQRWLLTLDISEVVVGTLFVSRPKLLAHIVRHKRSDGEP